VVKACEVGSGGDEKSVDRLGVSAIHITLQEIFMVLLNPVSRLVEGRAKSSSRYIGGTEVTNGLTSLKRKKEITNAVPQTNATATHASSHQNRRTCNRKDRRRSVDLRTVDNDKGALNGLD
jgi:hypothetical protein